MPSPSLGKRYGVQATIRGDFRVGYGSTIRIATQRAVDQIARELGKPKVHFIAATFIIVERPTQKTAEAKRPTCVHHDCGPSGTPCLFTAGVVAR